MRFLIRMRLSVALFVVCGCRILAQTPDTQVRALYAKEIAFAAAGHWPDWSSEAIRRAEASDRESLDELRAIRRSALSLPVRTLFDLLEHEYERRLRQFESRLYLTPWFEDLRFPPGPFAPGAGWKNAEQVKTVAEAGNLVDALEGVPRYVDQVIAMLTEGRNEGMLPSRAVVQPMLSSIGELVPQSASGILRRRLLMTDEDEVTRSGFYGPFRSLQALTEADRTRVQKRARDTIRDRALPAMKKLRAFVNDRYLPACPDFAVLATWKDGPAVYRALVRQATGTSMDPEQIHEAGLREVTRIRGQMEVIARSLGAGHRLDEFLQSVNVDRRFQFETGEELIDAYKAALARIKVLLPRLVHKLPRSDVRIVPVEHGGVAAMYSPRNEPTIFVEVSKLALRRRFEVLALVLHEGMPGHHLQISLSPQPSNAAEAILRSSAFSEGWALYAEGLGEELGLYNDPYDRLGQLSMDLLRAVRMVVDTGIHSQGWSRAEAMEYFVEATGKPKDLAELEVGRSTWPGLVLSYKVGEMRIRALRARASARLGRQFDLRSFHDRLIEWNPLPLAVLERKLGDCLTDAGCSAGLRKPRSPRAR